MEVNQQSLLIKGYLVPALCLTLGKVDLIKVNHYA